MKRRSFLAMIGLAPMVAAVKAAAEHGLATDSRETFDWTGQSTRDLIAESEQNLLRVAEAPAGGGSFNTIFDLKRIDPIVFFTDENGAAHAKPFSQFAGDEDRIVYLLPAEHEVTARIKNLDRGYSGIVWVR